MDKEELLRRREERLARGEIGERTYLDIKARYDAMPAASAAPGVSTPPESPRHAGHAGHPFRNGDFEKMIENTIESAMEQVAASLDAAFANKDEARRRMDEVNRRVQEAMSKIGPRIEEGGKVCVIRGSGTVPGGQHFEEFKCAGSGTVKGDLLADEAHVSGACVIEGRCVGEEFHASGRADIAGDVQVQEFHVSGRTNVGGDLRAEDISVSGSVAVGGDVLDAEDVVFAGSVRIGGDVKAEDFSSRGQFQIGGGIEAEGGDIRVAGSSKATSIKANDLEIRIGERGAELVADTIEAENVYLEGTRAGLVRGHQVRLGPHSTVHTVEADELEVHETATFKERRPRSA